MAVTRYTILNVSTQIYLGIQWAVANGAHVISLSLGSENITNDLFKQINLAIASGVIIVCAAANVGRRNKYNIGYPARLGNTICVGSHSSYGQPSKFSSSGREVDFLAPGENIWSTAPSSQFALMSGTSMAVPFVSGLVALILSYDQSNQKLIKNICQVRDVLREMCSKSGHHDESSGYGTLDPIRVFKSQEAFYSSFQPYQ